MSWISYKLGDICDIARGGSPRPIDKFITDDEDGVNWIKIADATRSEKYIFETKEKIKKEGVSRSRVVKDGDFLLSNSMSFGRPYIMRTTGCIHDGWLVLSKYQNYLNIDFFYYLLSSPIVANQFEKLAQGSTVRNLNKELVSRVEVKVPPLSMQQRIVAKLDEIFAEIDKATAASVANAKNAEALFQRYLSKIFDGNHDSWERQTVGSVCEELFAGGDVPKDRMSKERGNEYVIPIFTNGEKDKGLYGYTNTARVVKSSITISARGTIGYSQVRNEPFYPAIRLIVATPKTSIIELEFLKYAIKSMSFIHSGSSIPQLTVPMIKDYSVTLPTSKVEQLRIVGELNSLNEQIDKLKFIENKKEIEYSFLRQSILKQAFAGELVKE